MKPVNPSAPLTARYGLPWSEDEDAILVAMAPYASRKDIGETLGRSPLSVTGRCQNLGIRLARDSAGMRPASDLRPWSEDRSEIEERDRRMIRALALAMFRGDHLPGRSNASA